MSISNYYKSLYYNAENANDLIERIHNYGSIFEDPVSILGCSILGFERKIDNTFKELNDIANALDEMYVDVGISKAAGGGASVAGGAIALTGLILAPVTFGASLGLSIGGLVIGTAGGLTTLGASLAQFFIDKNKMEKAKKLHYEVIQLIVVFTNSLTQYMDALNEFQHLIEEEKNWKIKEALKKKLKEALIIMGSLNGIRKIVSTPITVIENLTNVLKVCNDIPSLAAVTEKGSLGVIKAIGAASTQLADEVAAPGIKIGSSVLLKAGGTGAKVLSGTVGVIGIGMGVWDIVDGALDIKNGSKSAKEFRKAASDLHNAKQEILQLYRSLIC